MSVAVAKLIAPPTQLKDRIAGSPEGLSFEEILAKSAAIVSRLSGEWRAGALHDVAELVQLADRIRSDPPAMAELLPAVFSLAHGIQGQAGTFGYGEVGETAAALCGYVVDLQAAGGDFGDPLWHLSVFDGHLSRMRRLLLDDIRDTAVDLRPQA